MRQWAGEPDPTGWLVAHRGDQSGATENSLPAFMVAAAGGAHFIECDIQFSRDLQPLVFHDHHLGRLYGRRDIRLADYTPEELANVSGVELLTLGTLLDWLDTQPGLTLFLEIKPNVLQRHRPGVIATRLASILARSSANRIEMISQSAAMLEACAQHLPQRRGWVVSRHRQPRCALHSVFLDKRRLESLADWKAMRVRVAVYTVNDADEALQLHDSGADFVETNYFGHLCRNLEHG